MDRVTKDAQIASLRRQLRDMDAQQASIEAQLAALLEQSSPARTFGSVRPTRASPHRRMTGYPRARRSSRARSRAMRDVRDWRRRSGDMGRVLPTPRSCTLFGPRVVATKDTYWHDEGRIARLDGGASGDEKSGAASKRLRVEPGASVHRSVRVECPGVRGLRSGALR